MIDMMHFNCDQIKLLVIIEVIVITVSLQHGFGCVYANHIIPLRQLQQLIATASQSQYLNQNQHTNTNTITDTNLNSIPIQDSILSRTSYSTKTPLISNATAAIANYNKKFNIDSKPFELAKLMANTPMDQQANLSFKERHGDLQEQQQQQLQSPITQQANANFVQQVHISAPIQQQTRIRSIASVQTGLYNLTSKLQNNIIANHQDFNSIGHNYQPLARYLSATRNKWNLMELAITQNIESSGSDLKIELEKLLLSTNVSSKCSSALYNFGSSIVKQQMWALQMLDSSAHHLPSGFLQGTLTDLGHYDQCLAVHHQSKLLDFSTKLINEPIDGQYCTVIIKPTPYTNGTSRWQQNHAKSQTICSISRQLTTNQSYNLINNQTEETVIKSLRRNLHFQYNGLRLGLCSPSSCTRLELQQILNNYLNKWHLLGYVRSCKNEYGKYWNKNENWLNMYGFDNVQCTIM